MAIVKSCGFRDAELYDEELSPSGSGDSASSGVGGEDVEPESSSLDLDCSDSSELDSGMESDDYDYRELGEAGSEFCQVGNQSCMIPCTLYDLPDLTSILSLDAWNNCLTDKERLSLAAYLPDMNHEMFIQTITELLSIANLHFGSPLTHLFDMLRGGLCEPRVVLYRQGLYDLQKRQYNHNMRKYHHSMIGKVLWMRGVMHNLEGYSIEEKIQYVNISRKQMPLDYEVNGYLTPGTNFDGTHCRAFGKGKPNGISKVTCSKALMKKGYIGSTGRIHPSASHTKTLRSFHLRRPDYASQMMKSMKDFEDDRDVDEQVYEMDEQLATTAEQGWEQISPVRYSKGGMAKSHEPHKVDRKKVAGNMVTTSSCDSRFAKNLNHDDRHYLQEDWGFPFGRQRTSSMNPPMNHSAKKLGSKKQKIREEAKVKSTKGVPMHKGDNFLKCGTGSIKIGSSFVHDTDAGYWKGKASDVQEETESDSSQYEEEDARTVSFSWKMQYRNTVMDKKHSAAGTSSSDRKKLKESAKKTVLNYDRSFDENILALNPKNRLRPAKERQNNKPNLSRRKFISDHSLHQPSDMCDYASDTKVQEGNWSGSSQMMNGFSMINASGDRNQLAQSHVAEPGNHEHLNMPLLGCRSMQKKRKSKTNSTKLATLHEPGLLGDSPDKVDAENVPQKKKMKKKGHAGTGSISEAKQDKLTPDKVTEAERKPAKKPVTLVTPTVHTGFSFSIVHLLSAVRKAMTNAATATIEAVNEAGSHVTNEIEASVPCPPENPEINRTAEKKCLPSLTLKEIVNRVKSNPGDPCVLETQEPLQDLVRGVLKIFSSKTAPLGAKNWKMLVVYEKDTKSWSWSGPIPLTYADAVEEATSVEAWNIPHKMLVKLVDAFANWLKNGQETLKQIGSLPPPPAMPMQNIDEKERFRDLRAQRSLTTISPSSDEVKAYFRKEELLRYQIPDRAFSYTAADGKKSIVAPLRRGGGKPTSKARDHYMLKTDRPPHVTILCLVRDAASRLPGSIGTRADVCTLIRDSQYIVEDITDEKLNGIVSGALDRLHYEKDPCVQYHVDRKLWVYLHRDKEEEDFEDDGTSSTKKWKKPRKDAAEKPDAGAIEIPNGGTDENSNAVRAENPDTRAIENPDIEMTNANCYGNGNLLPGASIGFDFSSGMNIDSTSIHAPMKPELLFGALRPDVENMATLIGSTQVSAQANPMSWEGLGLNAMQENRIVCQENSVNEVYDEEKFARERHVGLINTSLL